VRAAIPLLLLAVAVGAFGRHLFGGSWSARAPRLAIALWQAMTWSVLAAATLAGIALAVPALPAAGGLGGLVHACVMALRQQYATPGGAALASSGLTLSVLLLGRVGYCAGANLLSAARTRAQHRAMLDMLGRPTPDGAAIVIDDENAVAYCLPGRQRQIVLTSGALAALDDAQLDAVLAHERAHIRGRHHLVVAGAAAAHRAFPRVPLFAAAASAVPHLVELLADDTACRRGDRLTVAEALVVLAEAPAPAVSLAASGADAVVRVQRLVDAPAPLGRARRFATCAFIGSLLVAPVLLIAAPAGAATSMAHCPRSMPGCQMPLATVRGG
jgi:Zn-dependent protease with chaperone function